MLNKEIIIFIPSIEGGGVEKNLFYIAKHFSNNLKKVYLITSGKKYKGKLKKTELVTPFINVENFTSRNIKYLFCLIKLFFFLLCTNKEKIIFSFQANIYAILIAKLFNIKIIVRANSSPLGWSNNKLKFLIFKKIISLANGVVVNSEDFKKIFDKKFQLSSKCIFNPLDKKNILKMSQEKVPNIFSVNRKTKLINVGRFVDQKDQITILKSIKYIKDKFKIDSFEVVIIGKGCLKNKLKNFIDKNDLQNEITLLDYKKNPYPYIKQADIFLLSSKYEGLPNVLLEAAAMKKFIISSNCSTGPREILSDGKFGNLFKVGDYKKLSTLLIESQKQNNKKKIKLCYEGLKRYDFDKNLNNYLEYINSFC